MEKRRKFSININISTLLYVILLFPFFHPGTASQLYPIVALVYRYWRYGSIILITGIIIIRFFDGFRASGYFVILFLMGAFILAATYVNKADMKEAYTWLVFMCCYICFSDYIVQFRGLSILLNTIIGIGFINVTINLITMIVFPNGMLEVWYFNSVNYDNWYFGYKNSLMSLLFPVMTSIFVKYTRDRNSITIIDKFVMIECLISIVFCKSAATYLCGFIMFGFIVFYVVSKRNLFKNAFAILIIQAIITIIITSSVYFTRLLYLSNMLFARGMSFMSRFNVWSNAIRLIKDKIWIGYGRTESYENYINLGLGNVHNMYLQMIYYGGIFTFILFIILLISNTYKINRLDEKSKAIFMGGLFGIMVLWQFEIMGFSYLVFILFTFIDSHYKEQNLVMNGLIRGC